MKTEPRQSLPSAMVAIKSFIHRCLSTGATFRPLRIGDILRRTRVFSLEDILQYSEVSLDSNPLHLDAEVARDSRFKDRLVHGMLVATLFPCIISSHFPGAIYTSKSLHFKIPVYMEKRLHGRYKLPTLGNTRITSTSLNS